jgi:AcrR family transcriptional regulator
MADFVMLGANDRGSFALSKSKADLFLRALEGYADTIAAQLNRKLLPYLWELNGMSQDDMPKLVRGRVAPVDLEELGQYIQRLALSGVDLFPDENLDKHLRDVAGLPEGDPNRPRPNADVADE